MKSYQTFYIYKTTYICITVSILSLLHIACTSRTDLLDDALRQAGENRTEMEKVLEHFNQSPADSLKYRAACFLIANMPGHVTYATEYANKLATDSTLNKPMGWNLRIRAELAVLHNLGYYSENEANIKEDITSIKAGFLINHINQVFKQREKYEWVKSMPFNDFCEYLLPYRVGNETLILWRDSIIKGADELDKYAQFDNLFPSINFISHYLLFHLESPLLTNCKILPPALNRYKPDCIDHAYDNLIRYRSYGIPVAIDEVPCWGNSNGNHVWAQPIDYRERTTSSLFSFNRLVPKVYRNTFSRHFINENKSEYMPDYFQNQFLIDVTSEYLYCVPKVKEKGFKKSRYGYLCVSEGEEWIPVAQAENRSGCCMFTDIGPDIVYLPVYYDKEGKMVCVNDPFLLKRDGSKVYIRATDKKEDITVHRKYPLEDIHWRLMNYFTGTIEASRFRDFHKSDTVARFSNSQAIMSPCIVQLSDNEYSYFRISPASRHPVDITELSFFNRKGKRIYASPLQIHPQDSLMQDGNILTFGSVNTPIVFSIPQKERITSIHLLPRNDGNGIYPQDEYELFYFNKKRQWISIGKKTADSYQISFKHVPTKALLLLRNLTNGKQERIFTYEKGKQNFR